MFICLLDWNILILLKKDCFIFWSFRCRVFKFIEYNIKLYVGNKFFWNIEEWYRVKSEICMYFYLYKFIYLYSYKMKV